MRYRDGRVTLRSALRAAGWQATINFTQARIGVELGATPWAAPVLRTPASVTGLMSFDRPPPPPYFAEIVNLNGHSGGLTSRA